MRHTTTCDLGPWPYRGHGASIPTVAGCKAFLEEKVLCCGTGSLVQGTKVPKDPGIAQRIAVEVLRGNVCHDPQMKPSRIWMISGHRISRPTAAVTPPNNTKATKPRHTSVQISDKKNHRYPARFCLGVSSRALVFLCPIFRVSCLGHAADSART